MEKCFTQKRHWLVYDANENDNQTMERGRVLRSLNETRLFIDAEILYAVQDEARDDTDYVALYDVYNNGHHIGGKLNVTFDRHFVYARSNETGSLTSSVINRKTKYDNRCDLSDVTMRVGGVVGVIQLAFFGKG